MAKRKASDIRELGPLTGPGLSDLTPVKRRAFILSQELPVRADFDFYPRGLDWDADVHQEFEFGIVLSGKEERRSGVMTDSADESVAERQLFGPGDVWLCGMWEPHWWRVVAPDTSNVFVQFRADYLGSERVGRYYWFELFAPAPYDRPRVTTPALRDAVFSLGHRIREELKYRRHSWERAIRLDVLRVLVELARHWKPSNATLEAPRAKEHDLHQIMPALAKVSARLPNRVSLSEAAKECGISRALFCAAFKRSMGVSFSKFALRARLAWASSQLLGTSDPVAALAARAGFTDESHLNRAFVKNYGCTPGQYRRENLGRAERRLRGEGEH